MNYLAIVTAVLLAVSGTARAGQCTLNDVTIEDFTPTIGSTGDDPVGFAAIDGTLDSTCPMAANVSLTITAQTKSGRGGSKSITVDNVPPGGMAFSTSGVPYTNDTTGYEVTVTGVTGSAFNAGGVQAYDTGNSSPNTIAAQRQVTNSALNQAGNYAGWVASGVPWYYRH